MRLGPWLGSWARHESSAGPTEILDRPKVDRLFLMAILQLVDSWAVFGEAASQDASFALAVYDTR